MFCIDHGLHIFIYHYHIYRTNLHSVLTSKNTLKTSKLNDVT